MKKIKLTKGKYALVDDWNYEWLNKWKWYYSNGYAVRKVKGKVIRMHRVIMNTPDGKFTDHRDYNKSNNQEYNLRICTTSQNKMNHKKYKNATSIYSGVHWSVRDRRWIAKIMIEYRTTHIGSFICEKEAGKAYDLKAKELFGEFARLNFKNERIAK